MRAPDTKIVCQSCGKIFIYTASQQMAAKKRGLTSLPRRCQACRKKGGGRGGAGPRRGMMRTAKCTSCGRYFDTYDKPVPGEPVMCRACKSLQFGAWRRDGRHRNRSGRR
ncbi:MAG: zinc-ribbon domain containing protein [Planctomycetes bacterium]|nr:zinc-ribbon domain containing protein [Planctomycetota bacterium]